MKKSKTPARNSLAQSSQKNNGDSAAPQGAFSRMFNKQKPKVNAKEEVSNVLTHFAEDDLKRIAVMIQKWLVKDANNTKIAKGRRGGK